MSDSDTDTSSCIIIVSDTDEYSDGSDDKEDDKTDVEEENVSVPNKDKNQNTISNTSSANLQTKYKSSKKQIKKTQLSDHFHQTHNSFNKAPKIGVRKSTRVPTQIIKTETTVPEAAKAICENHQITCELCNHRIVLPKGIRLDHGQCINSTPIRTSTNINRNGSETTAKRLRSPDGNHNEQGQTKRNQSFTPKPVAQSTPSLTYGLKITKKEMKCCPACNVKFPNDRVATEHYRKVHTRNVLPCKYCDKYLSSAYKLKAHIDGIHAS